MTKFDDAFIERSFELTSPPKRRNFWRYFLIGIGLALLFLPAVNGNDLGLPRPALIAIPAAFALGIMGGVAAMTRRQRSRRQIVMAAWDGVQLEEWDHAEKAVSESLDRPLATPADRCQAYLALAAVLERKRKYEAALQIYGKLLIHRIGDPYQLQHVQIAMTAAKFRNEELTDAIQMLDRIEKFPMPLTMRALVSWTRLYQQVFMGQFEDAIKDLEETRQLFRRYLSTRAGYTYALFAKALHQTGRTDLAAKYWQDATLLIKPERLMEEYPFLPPIPTSYPHAEVPI